MNIKSVAILVNILAPYRIPIYRRLAEHFDVTILTSGQESNRAVWANVLTLSDGLKVKRSWGVTLVRSRRQDGSVFDERYLHVTPGYFVDLWRLRPDAIITNEMGFRTLVALSYGLLRGKPVWVWWGGTLHTERNIGPIKRFLRKNLFAKLVRRWISYGQTSTEYLLTLGIPRDRILQIQNCVDEKLYQSATEPAISMQPRPVLLYVGQMVERKGVRLLLEAAKRVQEQGYTFSLLLVGEGPEKGTLQKLSEELRLRNVCFYPAQPPHLMPAIYRSADCLVFPTLEDVWGLVVNEALWSGIPVLSSIYAGCTAEIVPPENRFDPLRQEEFDAALRAAIESRLRPPDTSLMKTCDEVAELILRSLAQAAVKSS